MKIQLDINSEVEPKVVYAKPAGHKPARFVFSFGVLTVECHPVHAKVILDGLAGEYVRMEATK